MFDWKPFLTLWSKQLLESSLADTLDTSVEHNDWLGFEGATEKDLLKLEKRLGVGLPPSYRSFLRVSNGWRRTTEFIDRIRPAGEIDWFRIENKRWVEIYSEEGSDEPDSQYYDYSDDGALGHRAEHMESLLQVSDVGDGVYLLNPQAVTPEGEWEAWFFASWTPGARRFPSFAHLMVSQHRTFAQLEEIEVASLELPTVFAIPSSLPRSSVAPAVEANEVANPLEELICDMASPDDTLRAKSLRTLIGSLVGRHAAEPQPELVQPIVDLFRASKDPDIRSACVQALTEWCEDDNPPGVLLEALRDPEPAVVLSAISTLTYFPDQRAVQPLCDFIESRNNVFFSENAISQLGELASEEAVPTLAGVLLDADYQFAQSFCTAAIALARCGQSGFDALVTAVRHTDPRIRHAAVVGLDVSENETATIYLDEALSDPDKLVRQRAKSASR